MNEQAEILTEKLAKLSKNKKEIDMFKYNALCALDIICGIIYFFYKKHRYLINLVKQLRNCYGRKCKCSGR
jgi:hypothetical protein